MALEPDRDETDMLAAEFAMRLLEGDDLRSAQARIESDPVFARAVLDWETRLSGLADEIDAVQPRSGLKIALFARLFPDQARVPLWERLNFWRWASFASLALAAGLAWVLVNSNPSQTGPLYTAEIVSETGDFRVVAVLDKSQNEVFLTRTAGAAPEGRILQVWSHGPGEPAISVGLWPDGDSVRLALPAVISAVEGTVTFGVSEEPPGGSLSGSPSGRVFGTVDIPDVMSP